MQIYFIKNKFGNIVGMGHGKHYSVNVPLREGMDDESKNLLKN